MAVAGHEKTVTARDLGLVACTCCTKVHPIGTESCDRCGKGLVSRDTRSLQKVWAYWLVGFMCYIPANAYPMLSTTQLGKSSASTIVGGAVDLAHHGAYFVAFVVLFASVAIPLAKFFAIAYLALSVHRGSNVSAHQRHLLYEVVEFIGRYSMIDVFVVALLSALVQLTGLVAIHPGIAAVFFALSVVFTMLSAQSFDARMLWDLNTSKGDKS